MKKMEDPQRGSRHSGEALGLGLGGSGGEREEGGSVLVIENQPGLVEEGDEREPLIASGGVRGSRMVNEEPDQEGEVELVGVGGSRSRRGICSSCCGSGWLCRFCLNCVCFYWLVGCVITFFKCFYVPSSKLSSWRTADATRFGYVLFYAIFTGLGFALRSDYFIEKLDLKHNPILNIHCGGDSKICYGSLVVYRMMLALCLFHFCLSLLMLGVRRNAGWRAAIHNGFWLTKFLLILVVMICSVLLLNTKATLYLRYPALAGAILFVFVQLQLLVLFSNAWSRIWVRRFQNTLSSYWLRMLILCTSVMLILVVVIFILLGVHFIRDDSYLDLNIIFISVTAGLCLLMIILSIIPAVQKYNPEAGIVTSSVISLYVAFLLESALASEPQSSPHRKMLTWAFGTAFDAEDYSVMLGLVLTLLPLGYYSLRSVVQISLNRKYIQPDTARSFGSLHSSVLPNRMNRVGPRTNSASSVDSERVHLLSNEPLRRASRNSSIDSMSVASTISEDGNYYDLYLAQAAGTNVYATSPNSHSPPPPSARFADYEAVTRADPEDGGTELYSSVESVALRPWEGTGNGGEPGLTSKRNIGEKGYIVGYDYSLFHFVLGLAALYSCMQLTEWNRIEVDDEGKFQIVRDFFIVYIKVSLAFASCAIYITLLLISCLKRLQRRGGYLRFIN
eukprot:Nk52_evm16s2635 gene=Nk52_evmTU16s2635